MNNKEKTCCFTGHRKIPAGQYEEIKKHLEFELTQLIHQNVCTFLVDGTLGFDIMKALTVLKLKEHFPYIRLILMLPCKNQTKG